MHLLKPKYLLTLRLKLPRWLMLMHLLPHLLMLKLKPLHWLTLTLKRPRWLMLKHLRLHLLMLKLKLPR